MPVSVPMSLRIGWRNLWRNRRRTALTAGGVGFAVFLVVAAACVQLGSYRSMEETATSLLAGHLQIQTRAYTDDQRLEDAVPAAAELTRRVAAVDGVAAVAPRLEAFALASAGERSFGAQVIGVEPAAERRVVDLHRQVVEGEFLASPEQAVLGEGLARNLGVRVGDEVVVLGSGSRGGVAALAMEVAGILRTGMAELDRSLMLVEIGAMAEAFALAGRAHKLVVRTTDLGDVAQIAERLRAGLPRRWLNGTDAALLDVRPWPEVLPDLRQTIEVDRMSAALFYWLIMILVAFSVVNTFIMTVFERTREFGMLLALGLRPGRIMAMLQWEAAFLWLLGASAGLALACLLVAVLMQTGIYLGEQMEQLASQMYMPSRLYPTFDPEALTTAPLVMLVGTQLAALLPSLRIRRLRPVEALRVAA